MAGGRNLHHRTGRDERSDVDGRSMRCCPLPNRPVRQDSSRRFAISLEPTRHASGIVRAMQPCNAYVQDARRLPTRRPADWPFQAARLLRPGQPGTSSTQEDENDFAATRKPSEVRASDASAHPAPSSAAADTGADGNQTVRHTMPRDQFCLPFSGTYPLASHIRFMAIAANGAADDCGR